MIIVDETSMVEAGLMNDLIHSLLQSSNNIHFKNWMKSGAKFSIPQTLVLCGDYNQIPPVSRSNETLLHYYEQVNNRNKYHDLHVALTSM